MIFDFYNKFGALNSAPVFDAFEKGLTSQGHTVTNHSKNGDVAVIWCDLVGAVEWPNERKSSNLELL